MPKIIPDMATINIADNLRSRSKAEQRAYDHPAAMHEYIFDQTVPNFHWEMIDIYLDARRRARRDNEQGQLLFLAPRDHAKTTIFAETIPLWEIGQDNTILGQIISSVDKLAKLRVKRVAKCIQFNPKYISLYGDLYPGTDQTYTWSPSGEAIEVKRDHSLVWSSKGGDERDPTLAAFGILGSVEGGRAVYQCYDDVVNLRNSRSEVIRLQVREKFWMSFDPMLLPFGVAVIIGTRYHYEDLYSELIPVCDKDERRYAELYPPEISDDGMLIHA